MALRPMPTEAFETRFAALLQQHRERLLGFLRRLCVADADAEDVLQETLAKVWRLRASFDPDGNAEGWLLQAAFRTFCDHRARRRRLVPGSATQPDALPAPSAPCAVELRDEVARTLAALPAIERELLLGFHRDGLSLRELAERHALPVNTVKSHLHRARQRLAAGPEER
ncbi:MAG: RNA polymerase sigma factor [Planctomycetota bacterium]|jgi:RNA polymerase sigma-70 factor (ECF subfamily)